MFYKIMLIQMNRDGRYVTPVPGSKILNESNIWLKLLELVLKLSEIISIF